MHCSCASRVSRSYISHIYALVLISLPVVHVHLSALTKVIVDLISEIKTLLKVSSSLLNSVIHDKHKQPRIIRYVRIGVVRPSSRINRFGEPTKQPGQDNRSHKQQLAEQRIESTYYLATAFDFFFFCLCPIKQTEPAEPHSSQSHCKCMQIVKSGGVKLSDLRSDVRR